jgi:vitamin B12 transporter
VALSLSYYPSNLFSLSASIRYIGKRYDNDFTAFPAERVELKEYSLVDLIASYQIFDNLRLYIKVDNIFNADYEEVLYYGTLGRSIYAGVNISY